MVWHWSNVWSDSIMERVVSAQANVSCSHTWWDNGILEFLGSSPRRWDKRCLWGWKCRQTSPEIYRWEHLHLPQTQSSPPVSMGCDTKKAMKQTARVQPKMEAQQPHQHCLPGRSLSQNGNTNMNAILIDLALPIQDPLTKMAPQPSTWLCTPQFPLLVAWAVEKNA